MRSVIGIQRRDHKELTATAEHMLETAAALWQAAQQARRPPRRLGYPWPHTAIVRLPRRGPFSNPDADVGSPGIELAQEYRCTHDEPRSVPANTELSSKEKCMLTLWAQRYAQRNERMHRSAR